MAAFLTQVFRFSPSVVYYYSSLASRLKPQASSRNILLEFLVLFDPKSCPNVIFLCCRRDES